MKADKEAPTVQYGVLTWGPCVLQIKISEEFQKKLSHETAQQDFKTHPADTLR